MNKGKNSEQKSAEEYFPVEEDYKRSTEKQTKEIISENKRTTEKKIKSPIIDTHSIEKEYHTIDKKQREKVEPIRKRTKKRTTKKKKRTTTKKVKYIPPKIQLKSKGYELIITEKPQAAAKIAASLGKAEKFSNQKIPYYEVDRNGKKLVIVSAVGHLFTLTSNEKGTPVFNVEWKPNFMVRKKDFTKKYYDTILKLCKNASSLTVATDFDVEGEVIGLNVVRLLCNQKDANRMKFSTLTTDELNKSYEEKKSTLNWNQGIAGETRHYLDWFYGINLSRELMSAIKSTGKFKIMSIGRVQGPSLNLIVQKEREILNFKSQPYWQVFITAKDPLTQKKVELKHPKDIFDKKDLEKFKNLKAKKAQAETKKTQQKIPPNPPFNLTTLQTEAYKSYGITPSNTLKIAQGLYLNGLISYPRTSSQKLPASIGYTKILNQLAKKFKVEHLIKRTTPIEGKKTDPAHPSIYPTGNSQILSGQDEKIYNLIVRRFLALFCEDALIDKKNIKALVENKKELLFTANGSQIVKKAWMEIYPRKIKEAEIPDLNGEVEIIDSRIDEKETTPPKRYSPASILSELEKRNLGTKATRANILETLYDRGYIKDLSIKATPLGISLIETLEKHSPIIIEEELTREFETDMSEIEEAKKSNLLEEENKILDKAKKTITKISKDFKKSQQEIGNELVTATTAYREQQKIENQIMLCPKCKKGHLAITYSKKNRKHFIACNAYPDCRNTFSLPPHGIIKKTDKICEDCGFKMLMALRKGKKPWFFCFNSECPSNKKRIEEYRKRQENN